VNIDVLIKEVTTGLPPNRALWPSQVPLIWTARLTLNKYQGKRSEDDEREPICG
jgi:hypothetical protein